MEDVKMVLRAFPVGYKQYVLVGVMLLLLHGEAAAQSTATDGDYGVDYGGDYDGLGTGVNRTSALVNFTVGLLKQDLSVFGQGVRIPYSRFAKHPCQAVFLGNPDWSTLELKVTFTNTRASACQPGQQPQAALAFIDGYQVPSVLSRVLMSSGDGVWVAVFKHTDLIQGTSISTLSPSASPPPPEKGSGTGAPLSKGGTSTNAMASGMGSGFIGRLRRRLIDISTGGFSLKSGRQTFQSAYDNLRGGAVAAADLLGRADFAPGPRGPLAVPVALSVRQGASVASGATYQAGALVKLDDEGTDVDDRIAASEVVSEPVTIYWAPQEECMQAMGLRSGSSSSRSSSSPAPSSNSSSNLTSTVTVKIKGVATQDSCFASQLVVYIYNPCAGNTTASRSPPSPPPVLSSTLSDVGLDGSSSSSNGSTGGGRAQIDDILEEALDAATEKYLLNGTLGYAQVLVTYTAYHGCIREGVDMLSDMSVQIMIFSALLFGWLLVFLLLPSLYRLFLEFPFRLLVHGIRKLRGKDNKAMKPLKPGLHSHSARRWHLNRHVAVVVEPVLRLRKHLLYAVITVHYSDGQSRWLQVAVISTVALSIAQAVYAPAVRPPLEHFVPPLALQISKTGTALATLQYFFDIVIFSSFMGTLGYLSMLANYNSPVNRYYRVQVCVSGFFTLLLDLLVLLQLVSLLAQWHYLDPSWPYLPLAVFHIVNLVGANVMQGVIFFKRHDQHNRAVYNAYVAAKTARTETTEAAAAAAAKAARHAGNGAVASSAVAADRGGSSSSGGADEKALIAELVDGDGSGWRQLKSGYGSAAGGAAGGEFYLDVKRHRERSAGQAPRKLYEELQHQQDAAARLEPEVPLNAVAVGGRLTSADLEDSRDLDAESAAGRRRRPQLVRRSSSRRSHGRPRATRLSGSGGGAEGEDWDPEEGVGGSGSGARASGGKGSRSTKAAGGGVVVAAAAAEGPDDSETDALSPPPPGRRTDRRTNRRRQRHAAAVAPEEDDDEVGEGEARRPGGSAAAADGSGAANVETSRPRRRLLLDEPVGPQPIGEAVEDSGSESSTSGAAISSRALARRRGRRSVEEVDDEESSRDGGRPSSSRRLLSASLGRSSSPPDGGGGAAIELTAQAVGHTGESERIRRLYGGDDPVGVPYHKRPYGGQRTAAPQAPVAEPASESGAGPAGGRKGSAPRTASGPGSAVASGSAGGALVSSQPTTAAPAAQSAGAPRHHISRATSLPVQRATAARTAVRMQSLPRPELRTDKDVLARLRDAAAAADFDADSDALDTDLTSDSSSCSSDDKGGGGGGKKKGAAAEGGGGAGGVRGVLSVALKPVTRLWRGVRESGGFRYPAWLLAALLVSAYMVIFHYGRALAWSDHLADCVQDPGSCFTSILGKYLKFVTRLLSVRQQEAVRDALNTILVGRDDLLAAFAGMIGVTVDANGGVTGTQWIMLDKKAILEQAYSSGAVDTLLGNVNSSLTNAVEQEGGDPTMADQITGKLTAVILANFNSTVGGVVDGINRKLRVFTRQQVAAYRGINATVFVMYNTINITSQYLTKGLAIQDDISKWRMGLTARFRWTSVLGFTLGLLLGLSTLVQTAASFRRAIRQGRRMRVARRAFRSLFAGGGAGAGAGGAITQDASAAAAAATAGAVAPLASKEVMMGSEESLLVTRAKEAPISLVVFFFGVLMSTAVIQLYMVGVLLSVVLAFVTHPWTWQSLMPRIWLYLVAIVAVFVLNKFVLIGYLGSAFLSNGDHIYRPAAWLAFIFIMSITNLVIGLLLAVYRIVLLLLTTVLALGKLEVTIFTFFAGLDLPHTSFLAGLHMHEAMSNFHDPIYLPGPRGRAHRRWRKLRETVRRLTAEELRLLATLGRPKEVQQCLDHVVVEMQASKELAAASRSLNGGAGAGSGASGHQAVGGRGSGSRAGASRFGAEGGTTATSRSQQPDVFQNQQQGKQAQPPAPPSRLAAQSKDGGGGGGGGRGAAAAGEADGRRRTKSGPEAPRGARQERGGLREGRSASTAAAEGGDTGESSFGAHRGGAAVSRRNGGSGRA